MVFPPQSPGGEGEQLPGAKANTLLDCQSPDPPMTRGGVRNPVTPAAVSRDALASDPGSGTPEGLQLCTERVGHDHTRLPSHPFVEHIPRLRRYARALLRDPDAADDLVLDTLERAVNKLHLVQPDRDMRTWLFSVLHNVFVDQSKKYRPLVALNPRQLPEVAAAPTQTERIEIAEVGKALQVIPARNREVLLLVVLEQMTYEETAKALSIPIGTVMSRLSRARDHLRRLMSGSHRV